MDDPKPIGDVIDEAMAGILGQTGDEFYAELVRQTAENRGRIEAEVRARFQSVFADVFGELTGLHADPEALDLAARMEAHRRIQAEIGRRISEEDQAFRRRVESLFGWTERTRTREEGPVPP